MKATILLVEGKRVDGLTYLSGLTRKGFQVDAVSNGSAALTYLERSSPDLILINAPSMRTNGRRICKSVRAAAGEIPIVLVIGPQDTVPESAGATVVLNLPFTLQKLLNRIRPLLPAEDKKLRQVGPFKLDVEHRQVHFRDRQVSLTPRLMALFKALMEHPGEVLTREDLFKRVWETAYIGDTRTLDVHISWLRQALEDDPRKPQYIKTVRGVGYRLDIG